MTDCPLLLACIALVAACGGLVTALALVALGVRLGAATKGRTPP